MIYGANVWDPILIVAQIVALQCLFYLSLGLFQAIFLGHFVQRLTTAQILSWGELGFSSKVEWLTVFANLLNSLVGAGTLMWIVERAKKCLDFASTCYFVHLIVVWSSNGFPASFSWWLVNGVSMSLMALVGEWLCVRREMQEIPLSSLRARGQATGDGARGGASAGGAAAAGGAGSSSHETKPLLPVSTGSSTSVANKGLTKVAGKGPGPDNV